MRALRQPSQESGNLGVAKPRGNVKNLIWRIRQAYARGRGGSLRRYQCRAARRCRAADVRVLDGGWPVVVRAAAEPLYFLDKR